MTFEQVISYFEKIHYPIMKGLFNVTKSQMFGGFIDILIEDDVVSDKVAEQLFSYEVK